MPGPVAKFKVAPGIVVASLERTGLCAGAADLGGEEIRSYWQTCESGLVMYS